MNLTPCVVYLRLTTQFCNSFTFLLQLYTLLMYVCDDTFDDFYAKWFSQTQFFGRHAGESPVYSCVLCIHRVCQ